MMHRTTDARLIGGTSGIIERVRPTPRPVDELIDDHELTRMDVGLQRTGRTGRDDPAHTQRREPRCWPGTEPDAPARLNMDMSARG